MIELRDAILTVMEGNREKPISEIAELVYEAVAQYIPGVLTTGHDIGVDEGGVNLDIPTRIPKRNPKSHLSTSTLID